MRKTEGRGAVDVIDVIGTVTALEAVTLVLTGLSIVFLILGLPPQMASRYRTVKFQGLSACLSMVAAGFWSTLRADPVWQRDATYLVAVLLLSAIFQAAYAIFLLKEEARKEK